MLISDIIDFKTKTVMEQIRTLHNDQGINPRRRYNICNTYAANIGAPKYININRHKGTY